jgi:hypothetical protein
MLEEQIHAAGAKRLEALFYVPNEIHQTNKAENWEIPLFIRE